MVNPKNALKRRALAFDLESWQPITQICLIICIRRLPQGTRIQFNTSPLAIVFSNRQLRQGLGLQLLCTRHDQFHDFLVSTFFNCWCLCAQGGKRQNHAGPHGPYAKQDIQHDFDFFQMIISKELPVDPFNLAPIDLFQVPATIRKTSKLQKKKTSPDDSAAWRYNP